MNKHIRTLALSAGALVIAAASAAGQLGDLPMATPTGNSLPGMAATPEPLPTPTPIITGAPNNPPFVVPPGIAPPAGGGTPNPVTPGTDNG